MVGGGLACEEHGRVELAVEEGVVGYGEVYLAGVEEFVARCRLVAACQQAGKDEDDNY